MYNTINNKNTLVNATNGKVSISEKNRKQILTNLSKAESIMAILICNDDDGFEFTNEITINVIRVTYDLICDVHKKLISISES